MEPASLEGSRVSGGRASRVAFLGVLAPLFAASAAGTVVWSASMPAMGGMPMSGQPWPVAAVSSLGMWVVMTVAMMLPSLAPALRRYREASTGPLAAAVGVGYFSVWTAFGAAAVPLGAGLAAVEMQRPALAGAVPFAAGIAVLAAGCFQFTAAKARYLAC
jgi:predicted metal-binding membrane protein